MNTRQLGAIGVAKAIAWFTENGYTVCVPISEVQRYDLIVEMERVLSRVEVKTSSTQKVQLRTCGRASKNSLYSTYLNSKDCELVFVVTPEANYLFSISLIEGRNMLTMGKKYEEYKVS